MTFAIIVHLTTLDFHVNVKETFNPEMTGYFPWHRSVFSVLRQAAAVRVWRASSLHGAGAGHQTWTDQKGESRHLFCWRRRQKLGRDKREDEVEGQRWWEKQFFISLQFLCAELCRAFDVILRIIFNQCPTFWGNSFSGFISADFRPRYVLSQLVAPQT